MRIKRGAIIAIVLAAFVLAGPLPARELERQEARIWYLDHSGWAIQTRSRFLIFDYRKPNPSAKLSSLDNGHIDPAEIKNRSVVVFISHSHGDHWDPRILEWKKTVPDITYVFGWQADQGPEHVYCDFERQEFTLGDMKVRTIVHDFDGIPEAAFVVEVDGLTLFHSGDHGNGPPPFRKAFVDNLEHIARIAPEMDLAFIPLWGEESLVVKTLKPTYTFPMHGRAREHQYEGFAAQADKDKLPTKVIAAKNRGDRFLLSKGKVRKVSAGRTGP